MTNQKLPDDFDKKKKKNVQTESLCSSLQKVAKINDSTKRHLLSSFYLFT